MVSISDMENLNVIVNGPELVLNTKIVSTEAEKFLPQACKLLIDKAKIIQSNNLRQFCDINAQIELRQMPDDDFCLFYRRDPLEWYELEWKNEKNIEITDNDYIKKVREENEKDNLQESISSKNYENLEKLYECQEDVGSNGNEEKCNFYVCKDYWIYETDSFYASARCHRQRVITICPRDHCSNEQWVQTSEAWEAVFIIIHYLKEALNLTKSPIERCFVNFGHWQSQAKNNRLQPSCCHAHINIVPTMEAIEACKGRTDILGILQHSTISPKNYRIHDVNELDDYIQDEKYPFDQDLLTNNQAANGVDDEDYFNQGSVQISTKSEIIRHLSDQDFGKANKVTVNTFW